jgi:hypothetical protein
MNNESKEEKCWRWLSPTRVLLAALVKDAPSAKHRTRDATCASARAGLEN